MIKLDLNKDKEVFVMDREEEKKIQSAKKKQRSKNQ